MKISFHKLLLTIFLFALVCFAVDPAFAQDTANTGLTGIGFLDNIIAWIVNHPGSVALIMFCSDRLAKLTPTDWDNKVLNIFFGVLYKAFAIVGAKVPDIEKPEEYFEDKKE